MQHQLLRIGAWSFVLACAVLAGCETASTRSAAVARLDMQDRKALAKLFHDHRLSLLSQGVKDCGDGSSVCTVDVLMDKLTHTDGSVYCLAQVPKEIKYRNTQQSNNTPRIIVWRLVPKDPATFDLEVEFEAGSGILILSDSKKQIDKGGHGNGAGGTSRKEYHMKNKHKEKGTATYLPIVMQQVPNEEPRMCAAADPKIINN